jgi:hypothetical protein
MHLHAGSIGVGSAGILGPSSLTSSPGMRVLQATRLTEGAVPPKFYYRALAGLEDFMTIQLANKEAKKKMSR